MNGDGASNLESRRPLPGPEPDLEQLRRAERVVLAIRWAVMLAWWPILRGAAGTDRHEVIAVHLAVAAYTLVSHILVRRARAIRSVAVATMLGDAAATFAMCVVTGGLASDIYPYFYLHILTTAIRFGLAETFAALVLDSLFSAVLFAWAEPLAGAATSRDLGLAIFYLGMIAAIAGLLSRDAKSQYRRAVRESQARHALVWRLLHAEEEERRRIAGEIHDRLGQGFFRFQYIVDRLRDRLLAADPEASASLDELAEGVRGLSGEARAVMTELRPAILDDFGFVEALREYVATSSGGPRITLNVADEALAIERQAGVTLFRILQEAMLNVRRHARADRVWIDLAHAGEPGVELRLRDNGKGFDPSAPVRGHFGLQTMRERAEALGGTFEIASSPGSGTELRIVVPFR